MVCVDDECIVVEWYGLRTFGGLGLPYYVLHNGDIPYFSFRNSTPSNFCLYIENCLVSVDLNVNEQTGDRTFSADCNTDPYEAPNQDGIQNTSFIRDETHISSQISRQSMLKKKILDKSKLLSTSPIPVRKLELNAVFNGEPDKIYKYDFGKPQQGISTMEKVIMVVGETGAGKTTLINGMLNYVLGVKWEDNYRFKLVHEQTHTTQAFSQTSSITAYTIHHQEGFNVPFTLTIIDTPGFGDTSGINRDKQITKQIKTFFTTTTGTGGIDHIDVIGFVAQASIARLTPTQKYVFTSILKLYGKDIEENIYILVTHAQAQIPPVLEGINEAKLPYKEYFKFNNSALFINTTSCSEEDAFNKMFWKMGNDSFKRFFDKLIKVDPKSLFLTKGVLDERSQLELIITGIRAGIKTGLNKLEQLNKEKEVISMHQKDIDLNKHFEYNIREEKIVHEVIDAGKYITNCITCNRTCHYPCKIPQDESKGNCMAITNEYCRICPGRCHWKMHRNMQYRCKRTSTNVVKFSEDLKRRYNDAKDAQVTAEQIMNIMQVEFDNITFGILKQTEEVRDILNRLQEIALLPNPLSSVDYIDILIQNAKDGGKPGWSDDVAQLQEIREEAEILKNLKDSPLKLYESSDTKPQKQTNESELTRFKHWVRSVYSVQL